MPCLRVWPRQYQNRTRERPGDCQELGHQGQETPCRDSCLWKANLSPLGPQPYLGLEGIKAGGEVKPRPGSSNLSALHHPGEASLHPQP